MKRDSAGQKQELGLARQPGGLFNRADELSEAYLWTS
jgi:hypothetical protein